MGKQPVPSMELKPELVFCSLELGDWRYISDRCWSDNAGRLLNPPLHLHLVHSVLRLVRIDLVRSRTACPGLDPIAWTRTTGKNLLREHDDLPVLGPAVRNPAGTYDGTAAFVGSSQMIVMSVASVLLSIMVALIPFIASRIVRGDIGGTLMTVISGVMTAGAVASGLAFSGGSGLAAGRQAPSGGPPSPPSGGSAAVSQGSGVGGQGSGGGAVTGDSRPPTPPSSDGVNSGAAAAGSASEAPSTGATPAAAQSGNESHSVAAQSASGY